MIEFDKLEANFEKNYNFVVTQPLFELLDYNVHFLESFQQLPLLEIVGLLVCLSVCLFVP